VSAALSRPDEGGAADAASSSIRFFAAGIPSTKGSSRGFVVTPKGGGRPRAVITNDAGPKAKAWAAIVSGVAHDAMAGRPPLDGAVSIHVVFYLPRPKSHSTKKGLRPNRPTYSSKKPDIDKILRCALDALIGVVVVDDALVARLFVEKRYADVTAGADFTVERMEVP
jgi:Holliday junction resolvase RusA-like endonuclease